MFGSRLLLGLLAAVPALATVQTHDHTFQPDHVLRVTAKNYTLSCESRYSVLVNGTVPGPALRLKEGKKVWIRVYNDMPDKNLTMHWHGLSQAVAPFSDGTPQASQWPIAPQHFFDYEVKPPTGYAGTYFYHSHVGMQALTATGPLIVEDAKKPPYKYDDEKIILLSDYFNKTDTTIETGLTSNPFVWSGEVNNVLVNGFGRTPDATAPVTPGKAACSLGQIDVEPGKTYRLRFIGGTGLSFVSLAFQDHEELTFIEADGQYTKPLTKDYLQMGPGQRFSVLLKTKTVKELKAAVKKGKKPTYYMQFKTMERPAVLNVFATLNYKGYTAPSYEAPAEAPLTLPNVTHGFLDYELQAYAPEKMPTAKQVTRRVVLHVQQLNNMSLTPQITWPVEDNVTWTEDYTKTPFLISMYENKTQNLPNYERALKHGGFDPQVRAFPAKIGEVLEIVIQAIGMGTNLGDVHPFHFHGAHYFNLGSGNGTYDAAANEKLLAGKTPAMRDTTYLYRLPDPTPVGEFMSWRAWRLKVTDPGVWMLHCHTLQHMIMGMQSVWVFGDGDQVRKLDPPDVKGYLTYGGSAYGSDGQFPQVNHFYAN